MKIQEEYLLQILPRRNHPQCLISHTYLAQPSKRQQIIASRTRTGRYLTSCIVMADDIEIKATDIFLSLFAHYEKAPLL